MGTLELMINLQTSNAFELIDTSILEWFGKIKRDYISRESLFLGHARTLAGLFCRGQQKFEFTLISSFRKLCDFLRTTYTTHIRTN